MQSIERSNLAACLMAADRDQVLTAAKRVAEGMNLLPLQPGESGLALMQWRDAVMHQPFYLGEVPMAKAAIALVDANGRRSEGGAVVMSDDHELAQALAVLDAAWAAKLPGSDTVTALAESGARARAQIRAERQAVLKRTRVDFALLSETAEEDDA